MASVVIGGGKYSLPVDVLLFEAMMREGRMTTEASVTKNCIPVTCSCHETRHDWRYGELLQVGYNHIYEALTQLNT